MLKIVILTLLSIFLPGDDTFTVRSFIAAVAADGARVNPKLGKVTVLGEDGDDKIDLDLPEEEDQWEDLEEAPEYLVNSLVDVDGGTGTNRLTAIGTEAGDRYK